MERKQAYNSRSFDKTLHANRHTFPPTLNLRCVTYNNTSKWRWKQTCVTMDIPERQRGSPPPRGVCLDAMKGFPRKIEGLRACILTRVWKENKLNLRPTISRAISKNLLKHLIACNEQNRGAWLNTADHYLYFLREKSACYKATKNRQWIASNECDDCHVINFQRSVEPDEEEPDAPCPYRQYYLVTIAPAQDRSQGGSAIEENKHNKNENKKKKKCRRPECTKVEVERKTTEWNMRGIKAAWS